MTVTSLRPPGGSNTVLNQLGVLNAQTDYGARANGTTNDYITLQAAVTQAALTDQELYLPPGTYLIGTGLTLPSGLRMRGSGAGLSTIKLANGVNGNVISAASQSNIHLADFTIDQNQANQTAGSGLVFQAVTDFSIRGVQAKNTFNNGFLLNDVSGTPCNRGVIDGCEFRDVGSAANYAAISPSSGCHGIALSGSTGVADSGPQRITITGCVMHNVYNSGVNASQTGYCAIVGNTFTQDTTNADGYAAVRLSNGCKGATVSGNTILKHSRGVFVTPDSGSGPSVYNVISGNYIEGCGLEGILCEASYITISGNVLKDCCQSSLGSAIRLAAQNSPETDIWHVAITGNVIVDTLGTKHQYAIRADDSGAGTCDYLTVVGNTITGYTTDALIISGAHSKVAFNASPQTVDRPSAATLTLRDTSDFFRITGTTTITAIATSAQREGRKIALKAVSGFTVTDGATIQLAGSVNFVMPANSMLELIWDNTTGAWLETNRSSN